MSKDLSKERWEYLKRLKPSNGKMIHVSKYPGQKHPGATFVKKKSEAKVPPKAL